jgi:DNA-binding transcriptional regulator YiaG
MKLHKTINERIGQEVRALRKASGLKQAEFCQILGLDQSALSRVENGKQALQTAQWVALCVHFSKPNALAPVIRDLESAA